MIVDHGTAARPKCLVRRTFIMTHTTPKVTDTLIWKRTAVAPFRNAPNVKLQHSMTDQIARPKSNRNGG